MVLRRTALERTESGGRNGSSGRKERKIGNRNHDSPGTLESDSMVFYSSFIGSLFQQIYSMADAVIVGRLVGVKELAGVGATGAMSFLVLGFATGITSGFSVVIAQRAGAEDREQIRISVAACCWLCIAVTVVMTILSVAGADFLLRIMNTPDDIFRYASGYIRIIFGGLGASIYYNMIAGILRAVGDSRTPLYFLIFSSVFNVVLDIAAVLVFHGGVEGASFATVISQLISAFLCHWYAGRKYPGIWPEKGTGLQVYPRDGGT